MATFKDTLLLIDKVSAPLKKMGENMNKFGVKTEKTKSKLGGLEKSLKKIGKIAVTAFGTYQLSKFGNYVVKTGMEFENTLTDLTVLLNSATKAQKLFNDIRGLAIKTPFETKDLLESTKTMLAMGISEEKVLEYTKRLGDIAAGDKNKFKSLVYNFSQSASAKRLLGTDLKSFTLAGFNPLSELSAMTGKSEGQLRKEMSKGLISFEMLVKAVERATNKGGRFFNLMDERSKTLEGRISNLQDLMQSWAGITGLSITKKLIPVIDKLIPITENLLNSLSPILLKLTDLFVYLFNTIGSTEAYQVFAQEFGKLIKDLNLFKQQHEEFFNALAVSFDWLLKTGVPSLLTSIVTVARYILDIISGIMKFFAKLGEKIGKTVGWVLNAVDVIETKLGKSQNTSLRGLTYEEAQRLAPKTDNSIAHSYNTTNITNNYQSLLPLTASAGISLGY